jgi:hypothetical protein
MRSIGLGARRTLALAALFTLVAGFVLGAYAPTALGYALPALAPATQVVSQENAPSQPRVAFEPFFRTELYFGSLKPDGTEVTEAEWATFLENVVTPAFPDGLTVLTGYGQFKNSSGTIIRERSTLLILLYPSDWQSRQSSNAKIEQIRTAYKQQFQQESVLRVDDPLPVKTSF